MGRDLTFLIGFLLVLVPTVVLVMDFMTFGNADYTMLTIGFFVWAVGMFLIAGAHVQKPPKENKEN